MKVIMNRKALRDLITIIICILLFFVVANANAGGLFSSSSSYDGLGDGLVAHYTFDRGDLDWDTGVLSDVRGANDGSIKGTMSTSTASGVGIVGQALSFDGVDDYVDVGDVDELDGQSALSVFAWIKITKQDGRISSVVYKGGGVSRWSLSPSQASIGDDNDLLVLMNNGTNAYGYTTGDILPLNTWTHVGFVFDGTQSDNAGRLKIYVNGVSQSVTYSLTIPATTPSNANVLEIGHYQTPYHYFPGTIDDLRMYNRALSADEVAKLYSMQGNNIFSKSEDQTNLIAHYTFDGNRVDFSKNITLDDSHNNTLGTLVSMSAASQVDGVLGKALEFDGAADYVNLGDLNSLSFGNGTSDNAFSIAIWVKRDSASASGTVIDKYYTTALEWVFGFFGTALYAWVYDNSAGAYRGRIVSGSNAWIPAGEWHQIVWVYDGGGLTSSTKIYIDGIQRDSGDFSGGTYIAMENTAQTVSIGRISSGINAYFDGSIDDVRIYNKALSQAEIAEIYGIQAPSYINVTAPSTTEGLIRHYTFDGKDSNTSTGVFSDRKGVADANGVSFTVNSVDTGVLGQAVKLDGSADYLTVADANDIDGTATFTYSLWIKPADENEFPYDVYKISSGSSADYVIGMDNNGAAFSMYNTAPTGFTISTTGDYAGKWNHLAATHNSSNGAMEFFVNGVSVGTDTFSGTHRSGAGDLLIGACCTGFGEDYLMNASIDDIRIYDRVLSVEEINSLYNLGK